MPLTKLPLLPIRPLLPPTALENSPNLFVKLTGLNKQTDSTNGPPPLSPWCWLALQFNLREGNAPLAQEWREAVKSMGGETVLLATGFGA